MFSSKYRIVLQWQAVLTLGILDFSYEGVDISEQIVRIEMEVKRQADEALRPGIGSEFWWPAMSQNISEINTNQMKAIISRNHGSGKWQKHWKDALVQKDIKMIHVFHALTLSISCTSPDPLFFTTHEKLVICMCMTRFDFDTCVGPQEGLYTQYHAGLCRAFASWLESGIEQHKVIL